MADIKSVAVAAPVAEVKAPAAESAAVKRRVLGFADLYALGIGQVIGAGVVTVLGAAMLVTGKSVWVAYLVAVVVGFLNIWPTFVTTSIARLNGGAYSYTQSLLPSLNPRMVGVVITTFFYVINLLKIRDMAKVQKAMTWLLIASLVMFCVLGLPKTGSAPFEFATPDYLSGGGGGFVTAVILLVYSTTSYNMVQNYSRDARRPKKDVPNSMWLSLLTIAVLYSLIGIVASGVLPIDEVAGQPLTYVARVILPGPLFLIFIVGGVIMALATTLNSMFGSFANICLAGARDGWFPKGLASFNRFGRPWILITVIYAIGVFPIILGLDVATVTNNIVLLTYTVKLISAAALYMLPLKYPKQCGKSKYYRSKAVFYVGITVSNLSILVVTILSASALTPVLVAISLGAILLCVAYSFWRYRSGKVKMENVFILDDEEEAETA